MRGADDVENAPPASSDDEVKEAPSGRRKDSFYLEVEDFHEKPPGSPAAADDAVQVVVLASRGGIE